MEMFVPWRSLGSIHEHTRPLKRSERVHMHYILTAIFPGEPGLAGFVPLILLLHLFLNCTSFWDRPKLSMSSLTQLPRLLWTSSPYNSFNFLRHTTFDPVIISFTFNMSKPS